MLLSGGAIHYKVLINTNKKGFLTSEPLELQRAIQLFKT